MVNIDTVYQKVLALANKEQRGYITPQEFNLFADMAQMEIFEQYFYDLNQFNRLPGNDQPYSDMVENIREKLDLFQVYTPGNRAFSSEVINGSGYIELYNHAPEQDPGNRGHDLYRIGRIKVIYNIGTKNQIVTEAQFATREEELVYERSKLLKHYNADSENYQGATYEQPVYMRMNVDGTDYIQIRPYPRKHYIVGDFPDGEWARVFPDAVQIFYTKKPTMPHWGYVTINNKPLWNADQSTHFELHASEEAELVYRILALAGISIEKPQITQIASGLQSAQIQQEKQ